MVKLNDSAIENLGMKKNTFNTPLDIVFCRQVLFEIKGLKAQNSDEQWISKVTAFGREAQAVICNSIDDASALLAGKNLLHYLSKEKDISLTPPFLLINVCESVARSVKVEWSCEEPDGSLLIYDALQPTELKALNNILSKSVARVVSSISARLTNFGTHALVPCTSRNYGKLTDGRICYNYRISMSVQLYTNSDISPDCINNALNAASQTYHQLDPSICHHLLNALSENEQEKQFMSYFLFIENFICKQYKLAKKHKLTSLNGYFTSPEHLSDSGAKFFEQLQQSVDIDLKKKMLVNSFSIWKDVNDEDIGTFEILQKSRNDISHGNNYNATDLRVDLAKSLAFKLIANCYPNNEYQNTKNS